ncbi:MAG: hypothetical protein HY319_23275 [Armatimonadetes bacterium]|nr:hypothetical protein [Armatimonadota bacterium]
MIRIEDLSEDMTVLQMIALEGGSSRPGLVISSCVAVIEPDGVAYLL